MAISIAKLKRAAEQRFRGSGSDFDFVFYSAINDVIQDLITETVIPDLTAIDEDNPPLVLDIDEAYYPAFREGVPYYMMKNAIWARQNEQVQDAEYRRALADVQARAIEKELPTTSPWDYEIDEEMA